MKARLRLLIGFAVFAAVVFAVPAVFTRWHAYHPYTMADGVRMALLAIAALGLIPLTGYANQVSLGQAAFYGTGAYASALLTMRTSLSPWLAMLAGAVLAGAAAYLLGLFIFRVSGHYLALATLALGLALGVVVKQLEFTGGAEGLLGVPHLTLFGTPVIDDVDFYYVCAGVLCLGVLAVGLVVRSSLGRSLTAVGDSAFAAAASGIDIARYKRVAFVLAAVLASVAGSLYAHQSTYVDVHTFDLLYSLQFLIVVTIGGMRTVWGAPVGAFLVLSLGKVAQEELPKVSSHAGGQVEIIAYGAALVVVLLLLPRGVVGGITDAVARLRRAPARPSGRPPAGDLVPAGEPVPAGEAR